MLTLTQIASIILLLQAFEVPQATIDEVRSALEAPQAVVVQEYTPEVGQVPAEVPPVTQPSCTEPFSMAVVENPFKSIKHGLFDKPVEVTTVSVAVKGLCKDWRVDYTTNSWYSENGTYYPTPVTVTGLTNKDTRFIQFFNPVPGSHIVSFVAYPTDRSTTTQPYILTFQGGLKD